jgi:type I restriction enzyme S subunit
VSFPRYPKYKDSGVEWLGQVPEHWDSKRVGYFFNERREKVSDRDFPALSVTKNGIVPQLDTAAKTDDNDNRKKVCKGDFVINSRSDRNGSAGASELDGSVSLINIVLRPQENVHTPFIHHLLRSQPFQQEFYRNGQGIVADLWTTNYSAMRDIRLAMPPLHEQKRIAVFLDRETGKIDELVAEQRRLMELLKEKRQAVISHAVTRGLNPAAPLKPSGIEWLNDIPAHWSVVSFKHLARAGAKTFTDGDWIEAPYITSDGVRLLQTGNVGIGYFKEQGFRYVSEETFNELQCTEVKPRDVLICRLDGPVGRACLAPDLGVRMITSVDNAILKVADDVLPEFVVSLLSSVPWISWIDALCRVGGGFRLRISRSQLGEIRVPLPPLEEQLAIRERLGSLGIEFDTLTAEAQRAIDLLQERRTALISAAVTGQIDVRHVSPAA